MTSNTEQMKPEILIVRIGVCILILASLIISVQVWGSLVIGRFNTLVFSAIAVAIELLRSAFLPSVYASLRKGEYKAYIWAAGCVLLAALNIYTTTSYIETNLSHYDEIAASDQKKNKSLESLQAERDLRLAAASKYQDIGHLKISLAILDKLKGVHDSYVDIDGTGAGNHADTGTGTGTSNGNHGTSGNPLNTRGLKLLVDLRGEPDKRFIILFLVASLVELMIISGLIFGFPRRPEPVPSHRIAKFPAPESSVDTVIPAPLKLDQIHPTDDLDQKILNEIRIIKVGENVPISKIAAKLKKRKNNVSSVARHMESIGELEKRGQIYYRCAQLRAVK